MSTDTLTVFERAPVPRAVLKNAIPAMAAMLMVLIYNLADTFFIAQTHNDILVAAVSLATPVFLIFMALGTIFGIGGTSVISRAFGQGRAEYAKKVCSFCMWGCVAVGVVMSAAFLLFMDQLLTLIGASADTWEPARTYLTVVALGGPFVLISNCYSNILRAEGQPNRAMVGQVLGNLLNVVLDPIMILTFRWGIAGAAIATVIGNIAGAGYYILYYLRGQSTLSIHIRDFSFKDRICTGVLSIGIPASLGSLLMSVSQIIVNARMAGYGDMALAGMGVAMKVTMMTGMVCIGFGQGVQPLLGYCVGAGLWERFRRIMRFSVLFFVHHFTLVFRGLLPYSGADERRRQRGQPGHSGLLPEGGRHGPVPQHRPPFRRGEQPGLSGRPRGLSACLRSAHRGSAGGVRAGRTGGALRDYHPHLYPGSGDRRRHR